MMTWCKSDANGDPKGAGAFLRFADDMRVLAKTPEKLLDGLDVLWREVCRIGATPTEPGDETEREIRREAPCLSRPAIGNFSNLRVNLAKLGPDPVQRIIEDYLRADRWEADASGRLRPPKPQVGSPTTANKGQSVLQWWKFSSDQQKHQSHVEALDRIALTPGSLNAFVTHLVERMSELGGERLDERFGAQARQRLTDLHQLVRFEIDDKQVRADTRLAFGTGKLVRACANSCFRRWISLPTCP